MGQTTLSQFVEYITTYPWPQRVVLVVLALTVFSSSGLIAIWAGLGRPHWFLRMLVLVGIIALPLAVPAHEIVLLFLVQGLLVTLPLLAFRRFRGSLARTGEIETVPTSRSRMQFSIRDLLLLTVIVAALSAVLAPIPGEIWQQGTGLGIAATVLAAVTLAGAYIGLGRRRWPRLAVLFLVPPASFVAAFLGCARASGWIGGEPAQRKWLRRLGKVASLLLTFVMLVPGLGTYLFLLYRHPIPHTTLPPSNRFEDLVRLGKALEKADVPCDKPSPEVLQAFVQQYRQVLDEVHAVVQEPCHVPLRYEWSDSFGVLEEFRQLTRVFSAEAESAQCQSRYSAAARIQLDILRLGATLHRGGIRIHMLVGSAVEGIGFSNFAKMHDTLSTSECRGLIEALSQIEATKELDEIIQARDEAWCDRLYPWLERIVLVTDRLRGCPAVTSNVEILRAEQQAKLRLLQTELAIRCYRLENDKLPETLADLVPKYLSAVPEDPFYGAHLVYRRTPQGYLLYSIGPNGQDDGGQPFQRDGWQGDIFLDEPEEADP